MNFRSYPESKPSTPGYYITEYFNADQEGNFWKANWWDGKLVGWQRLDLVEKIPQTQYGTVVRRRKSTRPLHPMHGIHGKQNEGK